ncbi:hypothetical protein V6N13_055182 [Hibiscus sabdariffa]|uniref:Uncharacterized protein n=2 Tax=Hibiscus sabdariffa TaxID=183260 RepID=A0ABR2P8A3_9ROSI
MSDNSSSSGESVSVGDEERRDREGVRGQVNVTGSREDGVKVLSDVKAVANADAPQDVLLDKSDETELGGVCWRRNGLWNGQEGANDTLVTAVRDHDQLVDVDVTCVGPVAKGSNTKLLVSNGHKRKVRLLTDIICSLQKLEEKRKMTTAVQRRGLGRPRKSAISTSEIADISLSDSDLLHRQEAILKETMEFGKLLDAKTIGCEAVIVQDIARIFAHSQ